MGKFKKGDIVICHFYEENEGDPSLVNSMKKLFGKTGIIEYTSRNIDDNINFRYNVKNHGEKYAYWWPERALTLVPNDIEDD